MTNFVTTTDTATTAGRLGTVNAAVFKRAVRLAAHLVKNSSGYECEDYVRIKAEPGRLTFAANVGSTYHDSWCAATIELEGRAYVRPKELLATLAGLKGEIELRLDSKNLYLNHFGLQRRDGECGNTEFESELPPVKEFHPAHSWELEAADLLAALNGVKASISKEESRYYLCGVFLDTTAGKAVATDGHKAQTYELRGAPKDMPGVIVADRQIDGWALALKACAKGSLATISTGGEDAGRTDKVQLLCDAARIEGLAVDGTYPEYERAWPESLADRVAVAWPTDRLAEFAKTVAAKARVSAAAVQDRILVQVLGGSVWAREIGAGAGDAVLMGNSAPPDYCGTMALCAKHVVATAAGQDAATVYLPAPQDGAIKERILIRAGNLDTVLVPHRA